MTQSTPSSCTSVPAFDFTYPASIERYHLPPSEYLRQNYASNTYDIVDTRVLAFDARHRILLLRREQDWCWELPGGAVTEEDGSLFLACKRQLEKASGLVARRIVTLVSEGKLEAPESTVPDQTVQGEGAVVRIGFEVEIARKGDSSDGDVRFGRGPDVSLDVKEHNAFLWASKAVLLAGGVEQVGLELQFTDDGTRELILDGFMRRPE